ncbi:endoglucanase [uncultured Methanobrevibacter sp.]|uniref:endoglucanase n=1 Tax=uncultured Methanobrevibacter sp. TaxID=253161 RepID=UPI0025CC9056|nr:endoglucanase [uncultured Methanobrevibacter sp.]
MDKANIIISIIVVLCVAAAVAAYGITNSDNPIFSDLSSMSSKDTGNGLGNNTTNVKNSSSTAITHGGSSSSSGSGSGSGGSSDGGPGSGGSDYYNGYSDSGSSDSSSSDSGSSSSTYLSYSDAQSIANSAIQEPGCYAGEGEYSGGLWYFIIYDANGNNVGTISVNDATGQTGED